MSRYRYYFGDEESLIKLRAGTYITTFWQAFSAAEHFQTLFIYDEYENLLGIVPNFNSLLWLLESAVRRKFKVPKNFQQYGKAEHDYYNSIAKLGDVMDYLRDNHPQKFERALTFIEAFLVRRARKLRRAKC